MMRSTDDTQYSSHSQHSSHLPHATQHSRLHGSSALIRTAIAAAAAQVAPDRLDRVASVVPPVRVTAPPTRQARDNARADTLEAWANTHYNTPRGYRAAGALYERAAALRGDDPRAVQSWRMAAWFYNAARDPRARGLMERGAERAAGGGDVERAANAYVDAAVIALADGRGDQVPGLLRKARAPRLPRAAGGPARRHPPAGQRRAAPRAGAVADGPGRTAARAAVTRQPGVDRRPR